MATKPKTIGTSMRDLRRVRQAKEPSASVPDTMIESIRQSMRLEGYDVSEKEAREVVERFITASLER